MMLRSVARSSPLLRPEIRRHCSTSTKNTARGSESFYSSSSSSSSSSSFSSPLPSPPSAPSSRLSRFLKYGFCIAVAGLLGTADYATCAYTADEVDDRTQAFRSSLNKRVGVDVGPAIEVQLRPLYSAIMRAPAKAVDTYLNMRRSTEKLVQEYADPSSSKLLPDMDPAYKQLGHMTLVLDLRETNLHLRPVFDKKRETGWKTFKRPGLDVFLEDLSQHYEIVVYTDEIDASHLREKFAEKGVCYSLTMTDNKYQDGKHYRDLSKLNRDPSKVIYLSGHAMETCLQPENCVPIKPWKKEVDDTTLIDHLPFLDYVGYLRPADIRSVLASFEGKDIPTELTFKGISEASGKKKGPSFHPQHIWY